MTDRSGETYFESPNTTIHEFTGVGVVNGRGDVTVARSHHGCPQRRMCVVSTRRAW